MTVAEMTDREIFEIAKQSRKDYLASHPQPEIADFSCWRCKAEPGETWRTPRGLRRTTTSIVATSGCTLATNGSSPPQKRMTEPTTC